MYCCIPTYMLYCIVSPKENTIQYNIVLYVDTTQYNTCSYCQLKPKNAITPCSPALDDLTGGVVLHIATLNTTYNTSKRKKPICRTHVHWQIAQLEYPSNSLRLCISTKFYELVTKYLTKWYSVCYNFYRDKENNQLTIGG